MTAKTTPRELSERLPVQTYCDLEPLVGRMARGDKNILTSEAVTTFVRTSGKGSRPKLIPVTRTSDRAFRSVHRLWLEAALAESGAHPSERVLVLGSLREEDRSEDGTLIGSINGLIADGALDGALWNVPEEILRMPSFAERQRETVRFALRKDLAILAAPTPAAIARFLEALETEGGALVDALATDARSPQELSRARGVRARSRAAGRLTAREAWPSLRAIGCWTRGPSGLSVPLVEARADGIPVRDLGYALSEGFFAPLLNHADVGGMPMINLYYFEFLEEGENLQGRTRSIEDIEIGKRYRPIVTTSAGLYRYDTEDIVEMAGRTCGIPLISFVRRVGAVVSVVGEKLTEDHVVTAISAVQTRVGASVLDFLARVSWPRGERAPHYRFDVSFQNQPSADRLAAFETALDEVLQTVNIEYRDRRFTDRLRPVEVKPTTRSFFEQRRHALLAEGTSESQIKPRHLDVSLPAENRA